MSPKYDTGGQQTRTREWHSDRRHTLAEWTTKPWVGHRHRYDTVEHRLIVAYDHGVGADVIHEVRSEDDCKAPAEWTPVEWVEIRDYGVRHHRTKGARWWE